MYSIASRDSVIEVLDVPQSTQKLAGGKKRLSFGYISFAYPSEWTALRPKDETQIARIVHSRWLVSGVYCQFFGNSDSDLQGLTPEEVAARIAPPILLKTMVEPKPVLVRYKRLSVDGWRPAWQAEWNGSAQGRRVRTLAFIVPHRSIVFQLMCSGREGEIDEFSPDIEAMFQSFTFGRGADNWRPKS